MQVGIVCAGGPVDCAPTYCAIEFHETRLMVLSWLLLPSLSSPNFLYHSSLYYNISCKGKKIFNITAAVVHVEKREKKSCYFTLVLYICNLFYTAFIVFQKYVSNKMVKSCKITVFYYYVHWFSYIWWPKCPQLSWWTIISTHLWRTFTGSHKIKRLIKVFFLKSNDVHMFVWLIIRFF